jgi:hypothetical protein
MSTERSDRAYAAYVEALQKFDYFVVGVSLALVAYLGATLRAIPLGWNAPAIELAAIVSFLLSAIAGLKRVEAIVTLLGAMQKRLYEEEAAGALTKAAASGGPALNESTGQVMGAAALMFQAQYHRAGVGVITKHQESIGARSGFWYRSRDFFLVLGLALLVFARIIAAYIP